MNISITIYIINLTFSVSILNVLLEGSVSQSLYLPPDVVTMK